jgi:hypothetical protein
MRLPAFSSAVLAGLLCCSLAGIAQAQPARSPNSRENVLDNLVRRMEICGETQDANKRLDCYDAISGSLGTGSRGGPMRGNPPIANTPPSGTPMATAPGQYDGNATPPNDPDRAYNPRDPNDQRGMVAADPYPPPPPAQVRRTGPGPLPAGYLQMPIVTLQTSQFGYNDERYWQVTVDVSNNIPQLIDAEVQCTFTNGGRPVKDAYFTATAIQPGEHVMSEVLGPATTTFVDGVTCRVLNPIR